MQAMAHPRPISPEPHRLVISSLPPPLDIPSIMTMYDTFRYRNSIGVLMRRLACDLRDEDWNGKVLRYSPGLPSPQTLL